MLQLNGPARISSFCSADQGQCVQVRWLRIPRDNRFTQAILGDRQVVQMTDSKLGDSSPVHVFSMREWKEFTDSVHLWNAAPDGMFRVGDLAYTQAEYVAFVRGVSAGEFFTEYKPATQKVHA